MVIRRFLIALVCVVYVPISLWGQSEFIGKSEVKTIDWGGIQHRWHDIVYMKNVKTAKGPDGKIGIQLADNRPAPDQNTELLLHFDRITMSHIDFISHNYTVKKVNVFPAHDVVKFGSGSAAFLNLENSIELMPQRQSILYAGKRLASFSIDFFLFPTLIYNNATVLQFSSPLAAFNGEYTGFRAFFKNGKLIWDFDNIFFQKDDTPRKIEIAEIEVTPLYEWHHHALSYNAETGLLTLYFDGKESNLKWVTQNGDENDTLLQGVIHPSLAVPLVLGQSYIGYMDEFRISRAKPHFDLGTYKDNGAVMSNVLTFNDMGTRLIKIEWESNESHGTAIRVFYRISDTYYLPEASSEGQNSKVALPVPQWRQVRNGVSIKADGMGKYFQWKVQLYGTGGIYSPVLHFLHVYYEPNPPPQPPVLIKVIPKNSGVRLLWAANKEKDISGYKIYYGTSSQTYFGRGAVQGNSPISVGKVTQFVFGGLKNEQVYFFSMTAFDNAGQESGFSKEIAVRPSAIYRQ